MLEYFSQNVTVAGAEKFSQPSKVKVTVWATLLLASAGFCLFHLHNRIQYYLEKPQMTDTYTEDHTKDGMPFPAVTICNANQLLNDSCASELVGLLMDSVENRHYNCTGLNYSNPDWFLNAMKEHSPNIASQIRECLDEFQPCKMANFRPVYLLTGARYCHTYTNTEKPRVKMYGHLFNLVLKIDVETEFYSSYTEEEGVYVLLHAPNATPRMEESPILAPPGTHTSISVRSKKVIRLPSPYRSNCKNDYGGLLYQRFECIHTCLTKRPLCNCRIRVDPEVEIKDERPVCTLKELAKCFKRLHFIWRGVFAECSSQCPEECTTSSYAVTSLSSMRLNPNAFTSSKAGSDKGRMHKNMVKLSIQYEDLETDVTEQVPAYTWLALLADMGGALGLAMGACLMTILQLLDATLVFLGKSLKESDPGNRFSLKWFRRVIPVTR